MNPADRHIAELIENLCSQIDRCFDSETDKKQSLVDQICQLRSSMNPVIIQKIKKD